MDTEESVPTRRSRVNNTVRGTNPKWSSMFHRGGNSQNVVPDQKIVTKVNLKIITGIKDDTNYGDDDLGLMKSHGAGELNRRNSNKIDSQKSPVNLSEKEKESQIRKIISMQKNTNSTLQDLISVLDKNVNFNIENISRKFKAIKQKGKIKSEKPKENFDNNQSDKESNNQLLSMIRSPTTSTNEAGTFSDYLSPELTNLKLDNLFLRKSSLENKPNDVVSVLKLAEKGASIIQKFWKRHQVKLKIKGKKLENLMNAIKSQVNKRVFKTLKKKLSICNNLNKFADVLNKIYKRLNKKIFLFKLQCNYDIIERVVKNHRKFQKLLDKKRKKSNISLILKIIDKHIIKDELIKMIKICRFLKERERKLSQILKKKQTRDQKLQYQEYFKKYHKICRRLKASHKFEKLYLFRLVKDFCEYKESILNTYKNLLFEKNEKVMIENLRTRAFYTLCEYAFNKLKFYYHHRKNKFENSFQIGTIVLNSLLKEIWDHVKHQIYSNRYYLNFDENYNTNGPNSCNEFNKIKCRTKNYCILNIFKIYTAYLNWKKGIYLKRRDNLLVVIVMKKSIKDKDILEKYFSKYRELINSFHYRSEGILEKAISIINKNKEKYEHSFNKVEKNVKCIIFDLERRLTDLDYNDLEGLVEMKIINLNLSTIQAAWCVYMQRLSNKKRLGPDFNQSRKIQLKKMRKMEEIFKYLFNRILRMDFHFFLINIKNFNRKMSIFQLEFRNSNDCEETLVQSDLYSTRDNSSKLILQKIVYRKIEKENARSLSHLTKLRKKIKNEALIEKIVKILSVYKSKRFYIKIKNMIESRKKLGVIFRRKFISNLLKIMWLCKICLYQFFVTRVKSGFNLYCKEITYNKFIYYIVKLQRFTRRTLVYFRKKRGRRSIAGKLAFKNIFIKFYLSSIVKAFKLIKLSQYGFIFSNSMEGVDLTAKISFVNYLLELCQGINSRFIVKSKRQVNFSQHYLRNRSQNFSICGIFNSHLRFLQIYWKIKIKRMKFRKFQHIIKNFVNININYNKVIESRFMKKWSDKSQRIKRKIPIRTLTKFVMNVYLMKKKFRRIILRLIRKIMLKKICVTMRLKRIKI
jgi:hypothetical protein